MRRLTQLSGSKLQLESLCSWWAQPDVPHADVGPREARAVGTAVHRCIRNVIADGQADVGAACLGLSKDEAVKVANIYNAWAEWFAPGPPCAGTAAEVTYAFDVSTRASRILGVDLDRRYEEAGLLPTEIPVTVDLVERAHDVIAVYDWKTGAQRYRQGIEEHAQLRAGGMCAARTIGISSVRIIVAYLSEDGVDESAAGLDEFDFAAIEESLVAAHARVTSSPEPRPGPHCADMWCPAIAACPSSAQATRELEEGARSPSAALLVPNAAAIRSREQAATMLTKLKQIDAMSEACWRALKAYVDANGPVPVGEDQEYAAVTKSRDSIRLSDDALRFLRGVLGESTDKAVKTTITKESIADATRALVGGGKKRTALEREVLQGLEQLGAVHVSTFTTHEVVKRKKGEAA